MNTALKVLVVIAVVAVAVALLALAGLFKVPYYPSMAPWVKETAVLTVVKIEGECVVVDVPGRLITKLGRQVTWKIRARPNECREHDLSIQFIGADPTQGIEKPKEALPDKIVATIRKELSDLQMLDDTSRLYIYQIRLESDPRVMGRGTLAVCPDWPCDSAAIYVDETHIPATTGPITTPPTTLSPTTTTTTTTPPIR